MVRGHVVVRAPTSDDLPAVLTMWEALRQTSGRGGPMAPAASERRLKDRLVELQTDPHYRVVVAEVDAVVVGMACFESRAMGPFVETPVVQIDYLYVQADFHRRGVGRALVAAAAAFADELGVEHVAVNVFPQIREANRFYARIGFTPLVVRRIATVGVLRRRLGLDDGDHRQRAGLLARRRSALRARSTTPA